MHRRARRRIGMLQEVATEHANAQALGALLQCRHGGLHAQRLAAGIQRVRALQRVMGQRQALDAVGQGAEVIQVMHEREAAAA